MGEGSGDAYSQCDGGGRSNWRRWRMLCVGDAAAVASLVGETMTAAVPKETRVMAAAMAARAMALVTTAVTAEAMVMVMAAVRWQQRQQLRFWQHNKEGNEDNNNNDTTTTQQPTGQPTRQPTRQQHDNNYNDKCCCRHNCPQQATTSKRMDDATTHQG